ncbi:MAG: chondroitinase family polysaccharide lyase [Opitutales bacterium]
MKATLALACSALLFTSAQTFGEAWQLFESPTVPADWSASGAGSIQTVNTRSLQGDRALKWAWSDPATILTWNLSPASTGSGHRVFSQWVRLETPLPETRLRVELRSTNGSIRSFEMNLDFTGWRTVFVPYSSMTGSGANSVDRVRWMLVGAPREAGKLYLDQVIVGQLMDTRYQYADRQVPFVWEEREKNMWENRVHWYYRRPAPVTASQAEILAARELRENWDARLVGSGSVTTNTVNQWESRMNAFNVRREGAVVRGNQIYYDRYPGVAYPSALAAELAGAQAPNDFQQYATVMLDLARGWHRTSDATLRGRIAEMLVLMAEHLLDQGWAAGSNQGSLSHYGYQIREYLRAVYLSREIFAEAGLLEEMGEAARWYGQAGGLLDDARAPNMDFFNTLAQGQMLSVLMEPDEQIQIAWLRSLSVSLSRQIADLRTGDANGFKPDGTGFHHNGHYPAYAIGGINTLGQIFDVSHETPFELEEPARLAFRQVLLAARAYSQKFDWPIGISGRHPFSGGIASASGAFAALAQYPDPVLNTTPDREVAAAYVRLWGQPGGSLGTLFSGAGIQAENPVGFFTFPFANHAVYRSGNWMVSLKGYSRYVWSSEIYAADNRYGRNQSNGTTEILLAAGRAGSGFEEAGWDWNRLPGTTAVHLPLDQLESPNAGTLMLRSGETMAGGVTAGLDGAFGFILNENRFGHTLKARKSVFAADGMLIALGCGIRSDHATAPAETTLFQVALDGSRDPITLSTSPGSPVSTFPWSWQTTSSAPFWVIDSIGNGYWIPPGQQVQLSRSTQQSRHNKTKATTSGDFSTGWLNHGVEANGEDYQYVILPQASVSQMSHFNNRMASSSPAYEVLRQNDGLHAVRIANPNRYGYAVFEPGQWEGLPYLIEAGAPSLLWIKEEGDDIVISVANPDLNPGQTESLVSPTAFLLRGLWGWEEGEANPSGVLIWHEKGNTRITVPAREGATVFVGLSAVAATIPWPHQNDNNALAPVENFRIPSQVGPFVAWDPPADPISGYVVERMLPGAETFEPIAVLTSGKTDFFDGELSEDALAYYRVRKWDAFGLGAPTRSLLIFDPKTETRSYDFRTFSSISELRDEGWTSSGLQSESDWHLGPEGMVLIDNSPSLPATVTVPLVPRSAGRVAARMGVTRMANFHAQVEVLAGTQSIGTIQMTTRTSGFLRGSTEVEFSDTSWDVTQGGSAREVSIEWRENPSTDQLEITLRYHGTTEAASAVHRWEIASTTANRPDRIRFSVGFNSAINRGLVVETLEIASSALYSLKGFYRAWAETFLGEVDPDPAADSSGNGISNLWEFMWARDAPDPRTAPRPNLMPSLQQESGISRFVWNLPRFDEIPIRVEAKEQLDLPWEVLPHVKEDLEGVPGWVRILSTPLDEDASSFFFRLVASPVLE